MLKRRKENPDEGRALLPSMSLSLIYPSWKNRDQLVRATSRATGSFSSGTSFLLPVQSQATQSFEPRLSPLSSALGTSLVLHTHCDKEIESTACCSRLCRDFGRMKENTEQQNVDGAFGEEDIFVFETSFR